MLIVGVTGGIACGKSAVSARLGVRGLPIVDLDELARRVVRPGREAHRRIVARFGESILLADRSLDREALGALIFSDDEARREVNRATHTPILWELLQDIAAAHAAGARILVMDAPLLFESSLHLLCATTVVVHASAATQLERLQARDNRSHDDAQQRISAQMPLHLKVGRADHLIENDAAIEATHRRVDELALQLSALAAAWSIRAMVRAVLLHAVLAAVRLFGYLSRSADMGGASAAPSKRKRVLLVVDMQKDYDTAANVALYGEVRSPYANAIHAIVPQINRIRRQSEWERVVFTMDWLPAEMLRGRTPFCLADSAGAALLDELEVDRERDVLFAKNSDDSFCDVGGVSEARTKRTRLAEVLGDLGCWPTSTSLVFVGQRFERCLLKTVMHARELGYPCTVVDEAIYTKSPDPDPEWNLGPAESLQASPAAAAEAVPAWAASVYAHSKKSAGAQLAKGYLHAAGVRTVAKWPEESESDVST